LPTHFVGRARVQNTWGKLVRIALCAEGRPSDREDIRRYQQEELGRTGGKTTLLELLPLPSPSINHWTYKLSALPEIATRTDYEDLMVDDRVAAIRGQIEKHKPSAVVFYGASYRPHWARIAGAEFEPIAGASFEIIRTQTTRFILVPHPVAPGTSGADFCRVGTFIRDSL
jgi:hypothetical protein